MQGIKGLCFLMFKKPRPQSALQNFKPLMKKTHTRYARESEVQRREEGDIFQENQPPGYPGG